MENLLKKIDKIATGAAIGLFGIMVVILSVNIVMRAFGGGIRWYMETSQFLNVWAVFIASIGLCATNDHLRIDALEGSFKGTPKKYLRLINGLLNSLFFAMVGFAFFILASKSRQEISTMPPLKMALVYWPIPFFCWISTAAGVLRSIYEFKYFDLLMKRQQEEADKIREMDFGEDLDKLRSTGSL